MKTVVLKTTIIIVLLFCIIITILCSIYYVLLYVIQCRLYFTINYATLFFFSLSKPFLKQENKVLATFQPYFAD